MSENKIIAFSKSELVEEAYEVAVNNAFNEELQKQVKGILPKKHKLITWLDKEKALSFVSVQSTNLIGNGNKEGLITNIINNFANVNKKRT